MRDNHYLLIIVRFVYAVHRGHVIHVFVKLTYLLSAKLPFVTFSKSHWRPLISDSRMSPIPFLYQS